VISFSTGSTSTEVMFISLTLKVGRVSTQGRVCAAPPSCTASCSCMLYF